MVRHLIISPIFSPIVSAVGFRRALWGLLSYALQAGLGPPHPPHRKPRLSGQDRGSRVGRAEPNCSVNPHVVAYLRALAPACATCPSCCAVPPLAPIAPTTFPPMMSGTPPSIGIASWMARIRNPAPPPATISSKTLVGRRYSTAARA